MSEQEFDKLQLVDTLFEAMADGVCMFLMKLREQTGSVTDDDIDKTREFFTKLTDRSLDVAITTYQDVISQYYAEGE